VLVEFSDKDKSIIYSILNDRPHLVPVFYNINLIPQLIRGYDKNLFIVYNNKNHIYELHSIENYMPDIRGWTTYLMTLEKGLDMRAIYKIYTNDIQKHGKSILSELDDYNDKLEESYEQNMKTRMRKASDKVVSYLNGTQDSY